MRLVAGIAAAWHGLDRLRSGAPGEPAALAALGIAAGIFLLAGLWTPVSGSLTAVLAFWSAFSQPGDPLAEILLGTMGAGLALVGPGAWSADARLFGLQRIDVRSRRS